MEKSSQRNKSLGAELLPNGGAHFRVWAPSAEKATLVIENRSQPAEPLIELDMQREPDGYFSRSMSIVGPATLYRYRLDDGERLYPDPVSRFQPEGPHGPSQLINPHTFQWTDVHWRGIPEHDRVIYEMHIGTFTPEGTYRAAAKELAELKALGITVIELMPVAEFDGKFGWGYDGVALFAPYHCYGEPDDLRHFINEAHRVGMGVILDVVYNHLGASGCYLPCFSQDYFSSRYKSEWGDVFNFDGPQSSPVREFVIANAVYWIEEFHFDGFRMDATQQIFDASEEHIITSIVKASRQAAGQRSLYIVAENEPQHMKIVQPVAAGGYGLDGIWNDDFHHSAMVALKGHAEAYFTDYRGEPQEFVSAIKRGFLFQGQWYRWQAQPRGTPSEHTPGSVFVHFLQNHDQVANTGSGYRIHQLAHAGLCRAFTALLLLGPQTPLLFQGQEFFASAPFVYFADHHPELAALVQKGRTEFLHQFPSLAAPEMQSNLRRPDDPATFMMSKLDLGERERHPQAYQLHKDLLKLRRKDPVFSQRFYRGVDGAVLSADAFVLRFFSSEENSDRLLLINMGRDLALSPIPEPLLAPHMEYDWELLWSSEHPSYGGQGTGPIANDARWVLPGHSALVLAPSRRGDTKNV